ncbi:TonB-dependent receptor domain-containing protein [Hyphococcus sp.]|uniref:TonB-dependent receptor domain-containing protein n=1 Tax=Hyphococcus sp. TaxID=2038636 RepID=UPI0035C6C1F5
MKNVKLILIASVSILAMNCASAAVANDQAESGPAHRDLEMPWRIPAQPLADALIAWSEQSGMIVLVRNDLTDDLKSPEIDGSFTRLEALGVMLAPSRLTYSFKNDQTLIILPRLQTAALVQGPGDAHSITGSPAQGMARPDSTPERAGRSEDSASRDEERDEVVVTGTRIRGAPPAAPQRTITRADIAATGQSQIGEVLRNIPQNSPGGSNRGVQPTPIGDAAANQSNATTVNLRGLGPDATLVLVNGHRLASDSQWGGPDVSVIPVAAIERIEIVTDGASALYGSDAVAGVTNFILRSDYRGAEASARLGGATQGGGFEQNYNFAAGHSWRSGDRSGNALGGVEFLKQKAIGVDQRNFSSTALPGNRLLAPQERVSAFFTGAQDLSAAARLELTALYTDRNAEYSSETALPGLPFTLSSLTRVDVASYLVAPRLAVDLSDEWSVALEATHSLSDNNSQISTSLGSDITDDIRNETSSVDLNAQGTLFDLASGPVRIAAGAGYRRETQLYETSAGSLDRDAARDIGYAYAETLIPLVTPSPDRRGLNRADLSAALRFEEYSDFGSTVNPRLGMRITPLPALVLRGTWGKSFKAPLFRQLETPDQVALFPAAAMGAPGPGAGMVVSGGNPDLDPERSTSWTAGFDWSPQWADGFRLSATYFDVDYTDRIVLPFSSLGSAFADPDLAPFIIRNPSPEQQAAVLSSVETVFNNSGAPYDPANIVGIAFASFVNASAQAFRGVDMSASYAFEAGDARINLFGDASWLDFSQRTLPTQELTPRSGLIFYPAKWRMRSGATIEFGRLTSTAAVNFVAGSTDNFAVPPARVAPWTTLDLNLRYQLPDWSDDVEGLEAALSVTNALDNDPPFAAGGAVSKPGVFFDSTNSSPVGRFIAVTLRQSF